MRLPRLTILVVLAALALGATNSAVAATPCWRQVVDDWYRNGRVDGHYPVHCYSEAIANLPEDSKQYSSAPEDIRRDMLLAIRGDSSNGGNGPGDGGIQPTGFGGVGSGLQAAAGSSNKNNGFLGSFFDTFGPKNASSIPLPLIILAAIALLLLAAGAASFVARRIQSRRVDPPQP